MTPNVTAALRRALRELQAERQVMDRQVRAIRSLLGESDQRRVPTRAVAHRRAKARRPRMSATARQAVGARMKAYWAKRRAEKAKAKP